MHHPPKDKSIRRLRDALDAIPQLKQFQSRSNSPQFEKWYRNTIVAISNTFSNKPKYVLDFERINYSSIVFIAGLSDVDSQADYVRGLDSAASMLESMIDEIREYWEDNTRSKVIPVAEAKVPKITNEVFIVHGKDNGAKETVARFLTRLELVPVILHEQPNQGRTIIEKFEDYAQVGFAVVLLTPDDTCCSEDESDTPRLRARQNVILELGFFLGKLGRPRTFALRKGDVEIPSDYDGVLYTTMDDQGAWRMDLIRELKKAGLDVDANRAL